MSRENIRPSSSQIHNHYRCRECGNETEVESFYAAPETCFCGGRYESAGESYPADPSEWSEERDDYYSDWHARR
jgi:hypothetical protein